MRLIDADELIETMKKTESEYENAMTCPSWWSAFNVIREQPTVYDIDKVIEELEKTMQDLSVIEVFSHIDFDSTIQSSLDKFLKAYNSELLRIIKQGYVSDDVCEWKFEETNGIAWHCDDKCTTYNQVYIKDLKITLEDFECKCPYCGKKIKVVE